jgi:hypothetical protein
MMRHKLLMIFIIIIICIIYFINTILGAISNLIGSTIDTLNPFKLMKRFWNWFS